MLIKKTLIFISKKIRRISNIFRLLYFRLVLYKAGRRINIFGKIHVDCPDRVSIGNDCTINRGVVINGRGGVYIGNHVRLSSECFIETGFLSKTEHPRAHSSRPVIIKDSVWIATRAVILPGVTIGENSIVAAGAVVTKNIPPNSMAYGVPAKFLSLNDLI